MTKIMYHFHMSKKILFVEDDEGFYTTYSIPLVAKGYTVVHVSKGDEAVSKTILEKPDLILLDIILPGMSGLDILKEIKQNDDLKAIKVVVLTNFSTDDNVNTAMELGADDYLAKYNVVPSELPQKVGFLLGDTSGAGINVIN